MSIQVIGVPYKDEYEDEVANLLADAYMHSNPFLKPLDITRDTLLKEFQLTLRNRVFRWPLIYVEKKAWEQGKFDLIGCWCWGDVNDFRPSAEPATFDVVPTKSLVRIYMRHKTMQVFFKKFNPKDGEWAYGSTFAITPKYQGTKGLSDQITYLSVLHIRKLGYLNVTGHAINDLAKGVFRRGHTREEIPVDVSDMIVIDTQTKPFAGLNLAQSLFITDVAKTIDNFTEKLRQLREAREARPKL